MNLTNDHNVYILGAGFSRAANLPLTTDFLISMRDSHEWLLDVGRKREADAVENVLKFRLDAASAAYWVNLDLENIEELFSLASATTGEMDRHIRVAIAATIDFIRHTKPIERRNLIIEGKSHTFGQVTSSITTRKHPQWVEFSSNHPGVLTAAPYTFYAARLLGALRDGDPKGQNTFITFNYDTILEDALEDLGIGYSYNLDPKTVLFCESARGQLETSAIPILKLHGSVNWSREIGPGGPLRVHNTTTDVFHQALVPEIIPPTWKKVFQPQLEAVWESAIRQISTATRLVVIGFSIPPTDMHFKYLLAAGLQKNVSLRQVLFVNPTKREEFEPRVRSLLRQAYVDTAQIDFDTVKAEVFFTAPPGTGGKFHTICRPGEPEGRVTI